MENNAIINAINNTINNTRINNTRINSMFCIVTTVSLHLTNAVLFHFIFSEVL